MMYYDKLALYHRNNLIFQCNKIVSLVKKPDVLFDLGPAKIGTEAWILKELWKDIKIFGFEPCTERYNNIKDYYPGYLYNLAISSESGRKIGFAGVPNGKYGIDFVFNPSEEEKPFYIEEEVEIVSLDIIYEDLFEDESVFIWADIEGHELDVLRGSDKILSEIDTVYGLNLELSKNTEEIIEFLKGYNFELVNKQVDGIFIKKGI